MGSHGFTTTCSPLTRAGTTNRLLFDGMGFVKASRAQASVKEIRFSCEGGLFAFYKAKSSDWGLQGPPMTSSGKCGLGTAQDEQHKGMQASGTR
jgi:hypothetical protein